MTTNNQNSETFARTVAHEVGHGSFRLYHTFSSDNKYQITESTDNLMDYPSTSSGQAQTTATTLFKYQWDIIHNPKRVWFSWLKEEEEGELKKLKGTYTIWVGDSIIKDKKILIYPKKENKIFIKYEPAAKDTNNYIHAKVFIKAKGKKDEISSPVTSNYWWNIETKQKTVIKLDSLPEGNYRIRLRENLNNASKIDTITFYLKTSECEEYEVKNINWISQISEEIKSRKCHWCATFNKKCCNGGTPCDTCPINKKELCCYEACKDSTIISECDSCNNKKICNTKTCKTNNCCYQTCLAMIEKCGVTTSRDLAIDIATLANKNNWAKQSDLIADRQKFEEGVDYLDKTLKSGKPVVIGVHYEDRKTKIDNENSATFHYMVIMEKVCRNGEEYYRFYDPGREKETNGASQENLLKIDRIKGMIYNYYKDNKIYTITEIRKNK